jgi:hypothetical protein
MWSLIRRYGAMPGDHPATFAERAGELLGAVFELEVQPRETPEDPQAPSAEETWKSMSESFGPLKELVAELSKAEVESLRGDFLALRERFAGRPLSYVIVLGRRR